MIKVRPILTVEEFDQVLKAADADKHGALVPTHYIDKLGHPVGAFSFGNIPLVTCWFSTKELKASETLQAIGQMEAVAEHCRLSSLTVSCPKSSPLFAYMKKLGFEDAGETHLFIKQLNRRGA